MTTQEVLANIVNNGNKILVVGGGFAKLGIDHPKVIVWDDEVQGIEARQIPITVKAILWGRNISHDTVNRLNQEIRRLHALKFPMVRPHEVRSLLSLVIPPAEPVVVTSEPVVTEPVTEPALPEQVEETTMAKKIVGRNDLKNFVIKNLNLDNDYAVRGAIAKEGKRLFGRATSSGIKTTQDSIIQSVGRVIREMKTNKSKPAPAPSKSKSTADDFAELKRLIIDAQTALKLVAEHMHKVEKEVESSRQARLKLLKVLEG